MASKQRKHSSPKQQEKTEPHCRFTVHLPVMDLKSELASGQARLAAAYVIEYFVRKFGGSTYVKTDSSIFVGTWYEKSTKLEYPALVSLLILDLPFAFADPVRVERTLRLIRTVTYKAYERKFVPQKEIWVGAQPILMRIWKDSAISVRQAAKRDTFTVKQKRRKRTSPKLEGSEKSAL